MSTFFQTILRPILQNIKWKSKNNAFYIDKVFYTYKDFGRAISKIRRAVNELSEEEINIGIVANDDLETYASIIALWLENKTYIMLHPHQPRGRLLEIISLAEIKTVLDSSKTRMFMELNTIKTNQLTYKESHLDINENQPQDKDCLAYILFTSGSTGTPKGVIITRRNIASFIDSFWSSGIIITENDRCLQCFDLTFDVSVQSYLVPLIKGACTYTVPNDQIKYSYVIGLLEDHQLTFGAMPPSMIRYLRPYFDEINIPSMRYNILTAEASPIDLIAEWSNCIPNADIFDFYGPTETTIYCTYNKFNRGGNNKQLNGMMSIGKPMQGLNTIIADENLHPLKANNTGELCISGDQLTPGYWKNPEKNIESFFEIENKGVVTRFYKTGDSCYYDKDGDIMLVGRLDYQVKIQGYRIELGEIEYHTREFLKGQNAIAISFTNQIGITEIALFIEGAFTDVPKLIEYLSNKMPYYMVPTKIKAEIFFPLNLSGKVDRLWLKNRLFI